MRKRSLFGFILVCLSCLLLSGICKAEGTLVVPRTMSTTAAPQSSVNVSAGAVAPSLPTTAVQPTAPGVEYIMGVGDRIRLTVYGEEDLSGEYEVGSTGAIALPLVGSIRAIDLSLRQFEQAVRAKLKDGYLNDPRVNIQVVNYRPFFILGEVSKPGSYPFVNGMTVLNAVALAGGYTYRSDKTGATIVHANDPAKKEYAASEDAVVIPGDIIRVPERFF